LEPWDWSTTAISDHPTKAVLHAVKGVRQVAGSEMDPEDDARLGAFHDLILGCDPVEVADALDAIMGNEVDVDGCMQDATHSVGWFGSNILKAVTSPITSAANFIQHPSLKNLAHIATDPITSSLRAAQPFAKIANMAMPFAKFVPGLGPLAASGIDFLSHGVPTNFGDFAKQAMHAAAAGIPIPGLPPELAQMLPGMIPGFGGGGGGAPGGFPGGLPRFAFEQGRVARPWGGSGPAVMRF
jgi:hypothetical protein